MSTLLANQPSIDWKAPEGISKVNICTLTGTLPCNSCPTKQEWFLDENKPTKACTTDQIQKILGSPAPITEGNILDSGASTVNP
jgi:membrane carboxypeptidase/penicillin-binding protein